MQLLSDRWQAVGGCIRVSPCAGLDTWRSRFCIRWHDAAFVLFLSYWVGEIKYLVIRYHGSCIRWSRDRHHWHGWKRAILVRHHHFLMLGRPDQWLRPIAWTSHILLDTLLTSRLRLVTFQLNWSQYQLMELMPSNIPFWPCNVNNHFDSWVLS